MNYNDYSDDELCSMICENNEDAKNILFAKYKPTIDYIIKKYSLSATKVGIEYNDFFQEALVAFSDALNSYNPFKEANFKTYVSLCIERRLQNNIIKFNTQKNKVLIDALSLDYEYSESDSLKDKISDNSLNDPLNNMMDEESYQNLLIKIKEVLSNNEYEVFTLMTTGLDYIEIAKQLNKNPKQIDNTMQRIKNKIKNILKNN